MTRRKEGSEFTRAPALSLSAPAARRRRDGKFGARTHEWADSLFLLAKLSSSLWRLASRKVGARGTETDGRERGASPGADSLVEMGQR